MQLVRGLPARKLHVVFWSRHTGGTKNWATKKERAAHWIVAFEYHKGWNLMDSIGALKSGKRSNSTVPVADLPGVGLGER
jgi:hypothetical protein